MKISVVMPVYNEEATLATCVGRVLEQDLVQELVAVDDGSRDRSAEILRELATEHPALRVISHEGNHGKGAALKTGFREVQGQVVVVQDADLEYDPREYPRLVEPILDGRADVVYGSRFLGGPHRVHLYFHYLGNRLLTTVSNICTNLNLSDMETCYKAFRREVVERLDIRSRSFAVEPEITAKIARMKARVYEIPISYSGRDYSEGKKIRWTDAPVALAAILRFNLFPGKIESLERPPRDRPVDGAAGPPS